MKIGCGILKDKKLYIESKQLTSIVNKKSITKQLLYN